MPVEIVVVVLKFPTNASNPAIFKHSFINFCYCIWLVPVIFAVIKSFLDVFSWPTVYVLCWYLGDNVESQVLSHTHRRQFESWSTFVDWERRGGAWSLPW